MSDVAVLPSDVPHICAYELERFESLGKGGCSEVFRGRWQGRDVAIKVLNARPTVADEAFLQLFSSELRTMQSVRDAPYIITVYGACFCPGQESIVMEYMRRGSLFHYLHTEEGRAMSWKQRIQLAVQAVRSINILHEMQPYILHGDIKSLNFLLDDQQEGGDDGSANGVASGLVSHSPPDASKRLSIKVSDIDSH